MSSRVAVYSGCVLAGAGLAAGSALALVGFSTLLAAPLIPLLEVAGLAVVGIGLLWSVVDILLLRARFDDVATELASAADGFTVERGLATALGERFVAVGYHLPDSSGHLRADGELFDALPPVSDLRDTTMDRHGQAVAVIRHRASLDPAAVSAEITPTVLVAINSERLSAVRGKAHPPIHCRESRARIVAIARDAERRRVEHNLPRQPRNNASLPSPSSFTLPGSDAERAGDKAADRSVGPGRGPRVHRRSMSSAGWRVAYTQPS